MKTYNICKQCKRCIDRDLLAKDGKTVNCLAFGCDRFPNHCDTSEIFEYIYDILQPERSKREDSVLNNIPEYGSQSSLNFDEWQRRCGALNSMET